MVSHTKQLSLVARFTSKLPPVEVLPSQRGFFICGTTQAHNGSECMEPGCRKLHPKGVGEYWPVTSLRYEV